MFRRISTTVILFGTALGIAAATAGPASAGLSSNHCEPLIQR